MFGQVLTGFAGAWLAAGLVAATALVTWLHMRRPRRRRVLVSFEELWAGLPGAALSRGWSARIRQIAPLALQLAVVWALLIAAADPRRAPRPQDGQAIAILVDCSASMGASLGGGRAAWPATAGCSPVRACSRSSMGWQRTIGRRSPGSPGDRCRWST